MTDDDLDAFTSEVRRVATIFRFRASPLELQQVTRAYFKAFRRRPLHVVIAGADAWIGKGQRFPKPAEWIEAMPSVSVAASYPDLTQDEADVWLDAERKRWEGAPCRCKPCQQAGVDQRPLRFVPDFDADDRDAKARIGERLVTTGHWAHGDELARWYRAKEAFYTKFRIWAAQRSMTQKRKALTFQQRMDAIFKSKPPTESLVEREPGEDG